MALRNFEEMLKDMEEKGCPELPPNRANGEDYEIWLRTEKPKEDKES